MGSGNARNSKLLDLCLIEKGVKVTLEIEALLCGIEFRSHRGLAPAVVHRMGNALPATYFSDWLLAAKPLKDDGDLLFWVELTSSHTLDIYEDGLWILWPAWVFFHLTEVLRHSVPAGTECPIKLSNFSPTYADNLQSKTKTIHHYYHDMMSQIFWCLLFYRKIDTKFVLPYHHLH